MTNRAGRVVLFLMIGGVSTAAVLCWGDRAEPVAGLQYPTGEVKNRTGPIYPKVEGPASLSMDLAQGMTAGASLVLRVSASSRIPVASGTVTLRVPEIAGEPNRTDVLWTGSPSDIVAEVVEWPVGALPAGKYRFVAIFEFTPDGDDVEPGAISQCLYVDVRPETILSSNVSFEQIKRLELRQELERRIVASRKPKLAVASDDAVAREIARLEADDPGFMDRAIEGLIGTDPEVASRVSELNERRMESEEEPFAF